MFTSVFIFLIPIFISSPSSATGAETVMFADDGSFLSTEVYNLDGEQLFTCFETNTRSANTASVPTQVISNGFLYNHVGYVKAKG